MTRFEERVFNAFQSLVDSVIQIRDALERLADALEKENEIGPRLASGDESRILTAVLDDEGRSAPARREKYIEFCEEDEND